MKKKEKTLEMLKANNEAKLTDVEMAREIGCPPSSIAWYRSKLNREDGADFMCFNKEKSRDGRTTVSKNAVQEPRYCRKCKKKMLPDQCFKHFQGLVDRGRLDDDVKVRPECVAKYMDKKES